MVTTYLLGLGSAVCFGVAAVVQQRVAFHAPPEDVLRLRLLFWLVRRPLWDLGVLLAVIGTLASAAALARSTIAFVAPLQVCQLLFALPLAAVWARRRVGRRDWAAAAATSLGLATFLVAGNPHQGHVDDATTVGWILTCASIGGLALWAVLGTRRLDPARRATTLAAGAGLLSALQGALIGGIGRLVETSGLHALPTSWQTYAVVVVALTSGLLLQSAYEMAPLPASLPAAVSMEPLAGVAIGVFLLGGMLRLGPLAVAGEVIGLAIMIGGVRALATSPLVTGQLSRLRARQSQGRLSRLEDLLHRDLEALRHDLSRGRRASTDRAQRRQCRRLHNDLDRIHSELARLVDERDRLEARVQATRASDGAGATSNGAGATSNGARRASDSRIGRAGRVPGRPGVRAPGEAAAASPVPAAGKGEARSDAGPEGGAGEHNGSPRDGDGGRRLTPAPRPAPGIESRPGHPSGRAAAGRTGAAGPRRVGNGGPGRPAARPGRGTTGAGVVPTPPGGARVRAGRGSGPEVDAGGLADAIGEDLVTDGELAASQRALDARADALVDQAGRLSAKAESVLRAVHR